MYNRYIPGPDGSFKKNRMQDNIPTPPKRPHAEPQRQSQSPHTPPAEEHPAPILSPHPGPPRPENVGAFFRHLIPKDFDTADLIILLLLLLMSGDCAEDQNTALLTMALYFFL